MDQPDFNSILDQFGQTGMMNGLHIPPAGPHPAPPILNTPESRKGGKKREKGMAKE